MVNKGRMNKNFIGLITVSVLAVCLAQGPLYLHAAVTNDGEETIRNTTFGGGYAVTKQLANVGYSTKLYNADNGLPTSDANCVFAASDGYIWIGGYSGVLRYDGNTFERLDASEGLTNAKCIYEDVNHNVWVGTNDNGVVKITTEGQIHYTYKEGLPSSTIRAFAEDASGRVYIGTTSGICYEDPDMGIVLVDDSRINNEYIIRMMADSEGVIYANSRNGNFFAIENGEVTSFYEPADLGLNRVSTFYADEKHPGQVYIGTDQDVLYYGTYGTPVDKMQAIDVAINGEAYWITKACGRIWVNSDSVAGYLDNKDVFHALEHIPLTSSIEMMVPDYQGNLWYASARQGVMKLITNNFQDVTGLAGLSDEVVNATCMHDGLLYIGTDKGLRAVNVGTFDAVENELTGFIGDSRIRCLLEENGNLWICTYTNDMGVICYTKDHQIISYTEGNGFLCNETRCATLTKDGRILIGTNKGLAVIKDGEYTECFSEEDGLNNTVLLTVDELSDGTVLCGSDGGGIYKINGKKVTHLGRDDGLTSDVILRLKNDEERGVTWVITSNSIEYLKDGDIKNVENFPYNNNFDIYYDTNGNVWVLSSYGVYCVDAEDMLSGEPFEYRLYNTANGMTSVPTGNAYSYLDENGGLYISGRAGVNRVNINNYFNQDGYIHVDLKYIMADEEMILPDERGVYTIPSNVNRIYFYPAVLDYSMTNPTVKVYFEEMNDGGMTSKQSDLSTLEYTGFKYGKYNLHIQVINEASGAVNQDAVFYVEKKPRPLELLSVRIMLLTLLALFAGFIVWRFMNSTIVRRQYDEIREAKEEAERANSAKSRFLANMSHEIRTPINTIMGMDEMILREDATDVPKGYFLSVINYALDIRNATESLLNLINDVLDISKIESGKMHLVEQEYDTEDMLRAICSMIRGRATAKDLHFDLDIDETLPKRFFGDEGKIKQIVLNLLTNAVKYTQVGGFKLKVSVEAKNGDEFTLRYSVKDTGIGVKEEDLDKLFSAYERLDEEKNSAIQGTGLGLDISRQFAELMNGKLWCESVYGEGSEFILVVNQKVVDRKPIGEFKETDDSMAKGPYVPQFIAPDAEVLVVDDNPMNLNVIKGLLKSTKMFLTTATSGEECLEKLRYGKFDIVLLDHMMPGMDGVETCKHIRETYPDLPVYALTANVTAGEEFYIQNGFDGYLAKPIDSRVLEKTIMRHLPEEIMTKATEEDAVEELTELPENLKWIYDIDTIDVEEGIKNSGGVNAFIFSLQLFLETIDGNIKVIQKAYGDADYMLYTVKVHALKSSCRIIGDLGLSKECEDLELAGNKENIEFIKEHNEKMLVKYLSYKDKLAGLLIKEEEDDLSKEPISKEDLKDAYSALKEVIPEMDYDSVEMILEQLKEYRLPKEDADKMFNLERMLKNFQWDEMEEMIKKED